MKLIYRGLAFWAILGIEAFTVLATLQARWTTDLGACQTGDNCGILGPDGPWQALVIDVGDGGKSGEGSNTTEVALYPAISYGSSIITTLAGGRYDPRKSRTANSTRYDNHFSDAAWVGDSFLHQTANSTNYNDFFGINVLDTSVPVNVTFAAMAKLDMELPNGSKYTPKVGSFGLAPADPPAFSDDVVGAPSPLDQLKSRQIIGSRSFSLHLGSAGLGLPGSLVLGGYEQNRALGDVGVFLGNSTQNLFLVDMMLGVEEGGSPFSKDLGITDQKPMSVWKGLGGNENGTRLTKALGGTDGSACVTVSAFAPYIYLPVGNCDAIAKNIPVTWRDDLKYYVWNVDDPQYHRLVSSPAYLGFVLADHNAKNITIKLPFALLNLTLEPPIVGKPTPYFPCQSPDSTTGFWELGRAFLQGAFISFNYDTNVSYFAQAPGPNLEQSIVQTINANSATIRSRPADSFAETWRPHWTALPSNEEPTSGGNSHISGGAIVGIVVGVVFGVVAVGSAIFFYWKRRGNKRHGQGQGKEEKYPKEDSAGKEVVMEAPEAEVRHEMFVPKVRHEVPGTSLAHELPADEPKQPQPSTEIADGV